MTSVVIGALFFALAAVVDRMIFHLLIGEKLVLQAGLLLLGGAAVYVLLETGRQIALYRLTIQVTVAQQTALYRYIVSLPLAIHRRNDSAELARTTAYLSSSLGERWARLVCSAAELLPLLIGLCRWIPAWTAAALAVTAGIMLWLIAALSAAGWQQTRSSRSFYALTRQLIQNVAKLRVGRNTQPLLDLWSRHERQYAADVRRFARRYETVRLLLSVGPALLVLAWAQPDIGASFAAWLCFSRLAMGMQLAASLSSEWGNVREYLAKLQTPDFPSTRVQHTPTGEIEVDNVVFRYQPSADPVLNGVSLRVRAGQHVAIAGISGAGKSTLIRLLAGVEVPESGSIRYDGFTPIEIEEFHRHIGTVLQNSTLSPGSIWSNINGFTWHPIEAAWDAARKAAVADVIKQLVMNMHTLIDEHAGILSRGQAQRLLLARALIHRARIVLLDDAISAVDDQTQTQIFHNLAGYTVIIAAQRLTTLQHMDMIYVLHDGRIAEEGSYHELLARNGVFVSMMQRQLI